MARRAKAGDIGAQLIGNTSRGVLLVGARGAGKTWMLGQILDALGAESATIRLSASKALAAIPFGAVNARVGANLARSNDYYDVLNGLLDQIHAALQSSKRVFLIVDNSEFLDSQSAAIIMQVVMSSEAKLIVVDQHGSHNSQLRELWRNGYLTRFELGPLNSDDVRQILEETLGGQIAGPTVHYLASRSVGNPLVLKGLISGAQEEGSLRQINGVWILDHPADLMGSESWEFMQMDLQNLPEGSRRIIEILALAGSLPMDLVLELSSPEAVDDIHQRDLVEIGPGPALLMHLSRPATAAPIRAIVPIGRSRRLLAEVSQLLPATSHPSPEEIINIARWTLDCGLTLDDDRLLEAAIHANQLMRPKDALQFCAMSVGSEHLPALLAEGAIALSNQNKLTQARSQALLAFELAMTPAAAATALRAVHLSHFSELDYEEKLNHVLENFHLRFGMVPTDKAVTRADIDVLIVVAMRDVTLGNSAAATAVIEEVLKHPLTQNASDMVLLKSLQAEVLGAVGKMSQAVALAGEILAIMERPEGFPRPDISLLAYTRAVAAVIYDGGWDLARVALEPAVFVNTDLMLVSGGLRDLAAATMACRRGHFEESLPALRSAAVALADYDPWSVRPTALALLAYALVMHGDLVGSQEQLARYALLNQRSGKFHELEASAYAAAAQVMTGQNELGLARLRSLQRECRSRGFTGIELAVLSLLVRVGDGTAIPRLSEVASLLDSGSKEFFVEWSQAMASQNPEALDRASVVAMDYGFDLIAVELATHALNKLHHSGKVHKSRKSATKVVAMREKMPGLVSPVFDTIEAPKMTRREHQIALLVAQGESNNSIATRLHVSLRTIEGHLYRTFIKLDIQSREQLASLINSDEPGNRSDSFYT
ncbi:LuxR family transcriptional regulator [Arthrobacter sp. N199823]|uniref:helix-turn-helix transcriptional regulator n=1 Tax=Arthrobacter sp. N199823 TaxID=2058895 RepID=UPI0011B0D132|nr:LuxR family transcriptional regulator [Arthrobacter sp. N199823]